MLKIIKWLLILLGIFIIFLSFFLLEDNEFSLTQENENIYKKSELTKLKKLIDNCYIVFVFIFLIILFFYNYFES